MGELLHIGPVVLYSYGTALAVAFLLGTFVAGREARRHELNTTLIMHLAVHLMAISLVAGRVGYVIPRLGYFWSRPAAVFFISSGGLSYVPALAAGIWYVYKFAARRGLSAAAVLDTVAIGLSVGLVVGSLGALEPYPLLGALRLGSLRWALPAFLFFSIEYGGLWHLASTRRRMGPGGRFWRILSIDAVARTVSSVAAVVQYGPVISFVSSGVIGIALFSFARYMGQVSLQAAAEEDLAVQRRRRLDRTMRLKVAGAWVFLYFILVLLLAK